MPFIPVFLWTDVLIYLLISVVVFSVFYIRRQPHLLRPWKSVFQRKRGVISVIILLCYVSIGLLDSVHFRQALPVDKTTGTQHYATEVVTLLDLALLPLRQQLEKTYSAPFATRLFVREMSYSETGKLDYIQPRLLYAGSHLDNEDDKGADIRSSIVKFTLMAMIIWLFIVLSFLIWMMKKRTLNLFNALNVMWCSKSKYPLKTAYFVLLLILIISFNLLGLSIDYHVLGTDKVGQDVLYQALKSIRTGLVIGTLTTLVMLPFAIVMGLMAGYFRGWIDDVIQYLYTTLSSIPGVLLIAASILLLQVYISNHADDFNSIAQRADLRLLFLCIILGITSWTGLCRLLRAEALKLREIDYVQAAQAFGVQHYKVMFRHLLPNVMHIVMISIVLDFSGLVLAEAVLSYINIGVDPSMYSWGNMINSARLEMAREPIVWWSLAAAFIFMFILVLAANLFSDAVRDAFDPRLREF